MQSIPRPLIDIRDVSAADQYDDESVADYATRRLNAELLDYFLNPLIRTLNLSRAECVSKLELFNALSGLFDTQMVALLGGMAALPEALAKHLDVRLNHSVKTLIRHSDHIEVIYRLADGEQRREVADSCVLATSLPEAMRIDPAVRQATAPFSDGLHYSRGLCVHLGYRRTTLTKAMMIMVPVPENPEIALLFLEHNKAPDRAPSGHSMITVFHDDAVGDRPWRRSDSELVISATRFVERVLPELVGHLDFSRVTRWPEGLMLPAPGAYKRMRAMRVQLDRKDRVQLAGDYFSTAGQNSAVVYGKAAAHNLMAACK